MGVNKLVYGEVADWDYIINGQAETSDDSVYTLADSLFNFDGVTPGEPIDKSLSCSGLGTESCWSHLRFYDTSMLASTGEAHSGAYVIPTITEDREVTNWCITSSLGDYAGNTYSSQFAVIVDGNTDPSGVYTKPENSRFAPSPVLPLYNGTYNPSDVKPVTQFSHKNLIACIYVRCVNIAWNASTDVDLYTYCNSTHNSYPIIVSVYLKLFIDYGQTTRGNIQGYSYLNFGILDNIQLPVTEPYMYGLITEDDNSGVKVKIMGSITNTTGYFDTKGSLDSSIKTYIGVCAPDTWRVRVDGGRVESGSWPMTAWGAIFREYDETFHDECFEQVACFGLLFTDKESIATSGTITNPEMYCGVLDENLVGHGLYTHGTENEDNEQIKWHNSNDSTYDPSGGGSGDTPYDSQTTRITAKEGIAVGGNWYVDSLLTTWLGLLTWCSGLDLGNYPKDEYFFGQNPIDCILEGKMIFVNDYKFGKAVMENKSTIQLGSYSGGDGVEAYAFTNAYPKTFHCGTVSIGNKYRYGDFRDFEPYTNLTLLLPFAGSIELPPNIVIGHTVALDETIDPQSGDLKYHVYIDGTEYASANGNCAIDLSINGLEIATYRQQKFNLQTQSVMATYNAAASLVGGASGALIAGNYGNIAGAASQILGGMVNASSGLYQAQRYKEESSHLKPPPARIQNSTPNVEWGDCAFPCIVMTAPYMLEGYTAASYQQLVGFATYTVDLIKNHTYWVKCEEVTLSGLSCTDTEQKAIKELLQSGIYIKPKQS